MPGLCGVPELCKLFVSRDTCTFRDCIFWMYALTIRHCLSLGRLGDSFILLVRLCWARIDSSGQIKKKKKIHTGSYEGSHLAL